MKHLKQTMIFLISVLFILSGSVYAGSWETKAVGGFDKVHLYTPNSVSKIGSGKALLIALHGCAQTSDDMKGAKWDQAAETYGTVIALPEAKYKEGFSCWGYWTGTPSRTYNDYANILNMVKALLADISKNIDKDQVYIAGLSSGGAFAMQTGCLAPDVFAGMGLDACPSAGTDSSCAISSFCSDVDTVASKCLSYAGTSKTYFATQITSTAFGTKDTTVSTSYAPQNAKAMAKIYGATFDKSVTTSYGKLDTWLFDTSTVVTMNTVNDIQHAWPGGTGASGGYVANTAFNYGEYLCKYFSESNRRVSRNQAPVVEITSVKVDGSSIIVSGTAIDSDAGDSVKSVKVKFLDIDKNVIIAESNATSFTAPNFTHQVAWPSNDTYYIPVITATDSFGANKPKTGDKIQVGNPPVPPDVTANAAPNGKCVKVTGMIIPGSREIGSVQVKIGSGNYENATFTSTTYSFEKCDLAYAKYDIETKACDVQSLCDTAKTTAELIAPYVEENGNISDHVSRYTNYPNDNYPTSPSNGYGLCDKTYVELNSQYGVSTQFKIYGTEDKSVWCLSPNNLPAPGSVNNKPVITLKGDAKITITVGSTFTDPGATATDKEDGDLTSKIVVTGQVNTGSAGTYTLKYNVTDSTGMAASEVLRTVVVSQNGGTCKSYTSTIGTHVFYKRAYSTGIYVKTYYATGSNIKLTGTYYTTIILYENSNAPGKYYPNACP